MKHFRLLAVCGLAAAAVVVPAGAAVGSPPQGPFEDNDAVWGCSGDPGVALPPYHCLNLKSQGSTGVIHVFAPDERWPQEGISTDPRSDTRPCPHDPAATDGTWWSPLPGIWVCHHRPS